MLNLGNIQTVLAPVLAGLEDGFTEDVAFRTYDNTIHYELYNGGRQIGKEMRLKVQKWIEESERRMVEKYGG